MKDGLSRGDVVLITGAGQGIGRAIALDLAAHGASLCLLDVNGPEVARVADECRREGGVVISRELDVSDAEEVKIAVSEATDVLGAIYAVISNAGIFPRASVMEAAPSLWERVLQVNLLGAVYCAQAALKSMAPAKRGVIINVASGRALHGALRGAHYAASKAAVIAFTKSLALEVAPLGLRCNCIIPGLTETAQPLADSSLHELIEVGRRTVPLGRMGQPEDLTGTVRFLLSGDAAFITGQSIAVNGGAIMLP